MFYSLKEIFMFQIICLKIVQYRIHSKVAKTSTFYKVRLRRQNLRQSINLITKYHNSYIKLLPRFSLTNWRIENNSRVFRYTQHPIMFFLELYEQILSDSFTFVLIASVVIFFAYLLHNLSYIFCTMLCPSFKWKLMYKPRSTVLVQT